MSGRRMVLVATCMMFTQASLALVRPMTSYKLLDLGYALPVIGWIAALYALAPLILALPIGRFSRGPRAGSIAVIGSLALILGCVGLVVAQTALMVGAASAVLGAGNLAQMVGYQSLVAHESAVGDYDRAYGWYASGTSVGHLIGPLLGAWVFEQVHPQSRGLTAAMIVGLVAAVLGLLATMLLSRMSPVMLMRAVGAAWRKRAPSEADWQPLPIVRISALGSLRHRGAKTSIYVSLIILSSIDLLSVYLPVLGTERGLSAGLVGVLLATRAMFSLLSRIALGALASRNSRRNILLYSVGASSLFLGAVPFVAQPVLLIALMALLGTAIGIGGPVSLAWTVSIVPPNARSTVIAVRLMGNRLGQVLTPAASSLFVTAGGAASVFWMMGLLLASSAGAVAMTREPPIAGPSLLDAEPG